MAQPAKCYRLGPNGLSLFVRVTPNAGRDAIEGVELRDDDTAVLRLRVSAVPDKGKANAAVVALLARALGVPKSAVSVSSGETSRFKTLSISGDGPALATGIEALG
ncbi:hypothetical protein ASD04_09340 [Devosia sp. Root436]|uniref:DUF167 family protein n=1 Tax=Devosia sp. Root436 TaxID=1736537 RepID=UPI000700BF39|nr:DUF167 family protein [Devosia sp. Root436]KQX38993.1 hypothetical protein ASD04_09340 [Devosia sp. Root436]